MSTVRRLGISPEQKKLECVRDSVRVLADNLNRVFLEGEELKIPKNFYERIEKFITVQLRIMDV